MVVGNSDPKAEAPVGVGVDPRSRFADSNVLWRLPDLENRAYLDESGKGPVGSLAE